MYRACITLIVVVGLVATMWGLWASPYLPAFHDQYQAERIYEMSRSLAFGQFPPRYVENLGYGFGYPLFNFYGPFPYYVGALFYLLSIDLVIATKMTISLGFIAAFATMFVCAKRLWGKQAALIAAVLYTYAPYHAVQIYVRGAVGELFAYALLPLVALGCLELIQKTKSNKNIAISIAGTTLLYLSHTVSLYMVGLCVTIFTLLIIAFKVASKDRKAQFADIRSALVWYALPLLLSAYFWLPAIIELPATRLNTSTGNDVNFAEHFLTIDQLWNSPWGYGGSAYESDGMSFMLGKAAIILALVSSIAHVLMRKKHNAHAPFQHKIMITLLILIIFTIFLTTSASQVIWSSIPMFTLIQFPWRWLMFISFFTCLLASSTMLYVQQFRYPQIISGTILALLTFQLIFSINGQVKFFRPAKYYTKNSQEIIELPHLWGEVSAVSDEYLYKNVVPPSSLEDLQHILSCSMPCVVEAEQYTPTQLNITITVNNSGQINIPKANFPGFKAYINEQATTIAEYEGMLGVTIPSAGTYQIRFELLNTPVRTIANMLSLSTLLVITALFFKFRKKHGIRRRS